jgi:putative membrane protein
MRRERNLGKGLLAGVIGGLVGTIVMTEFQNAWSAASQSIKNRNSGPDQQNRQKVDGPEKEDATMKAAGKIVQLTGRKLSHEQKKKLGPVVHYGFGTIQGGVYGAVTEMAGGAKGFLPGMVFGASLFVLADELAVPAMGLSSRKAPLSAHLYALASHMVYGVSTEITRRGLRATLG